jgi:hypothetical protein
MSGDARVSQKGTKTRKRAATHATALVTNGRCPKCNARHIIACQASNSKTDRMCCQCGHFFDADPEGTYRDGINVLRCATCLGEVRFVETTRGPAKTCLCTNQEKTL